MRPCFILCGAKTPSHFFFLCSRQPPARKARICASTVFFTEEAFVARGVLSRRAQLVACSFAAFGRLGRADQDAVGAVEDVGQ